MEAVLDEALSSVTASLVAAAKAGDQSAFGRLVDPLLPSSLGAARIIAGSDDAADAVQDALITAWRGLDGLRDPDAFPAWFRRHVVRSALRSAGRRPRLVELDPSHPSMDGELDRAVELRQLGRAFGRLHAKDRALLTLHHYLGLPVAETAGALGVPEGTVKSRVHHALARLRAAYDAEGRR